MLRSKLMRATSKAFASVTQTFFTAGPLPTFSAGVVTLAAVPLGAERAGRIVAVFVCGGGSVVGSVTNVTVGGVAATLAVRTSADEVRHNSIWYAHLSTGTTGNVVVTHSDSAKASTVFVAVAAVYGAKVGTPVTAQAQYTQSGGSPNISATITAVFGSALFAGYSHGGANAGTTASWTNAEEQAEVYESPMIASSATKHRTPAGSYTVGATSTDVGSSETGIVIAAWA